MQFDYVPSIEMLQVIKGEIRIDEKELLLTSMKGHCTNNDAEVVCGTNSVISSLMLHCDVAESQGLSTWRKRNEILDVSLLSSVFITCVIPHNL